MINYFIPLWGAFLDSGIFEEYFVSVFCLFFIVTIPVIIRYFLRW